MIKKFSNKGLTIPEVLISAVLIALVITSVLSSWFLFYKNWWTQQLRNELQVNAEMAIEQIKNEIRLSSATYMSIYEYSVSGTNCAAISCPQATSDANGFFSLGSDGLINWDKSVIYHVFENPAGSGTFELRRTLFTSNHAILINKTSREAQLISVATTGDGSAAQNSENATTKTLLKINSGISFTLIPLEFDGYNTTATRSDDINFGSIRLASGAHTLKFTVTGKNPNSSGYGFGIDTLSIVPSGCVLEAEHYVPTGLSDVQATGWSGNYYTEKSSAAVNDTVSFGLYYDLYREANFYNSIRDNIVLTSPVITAKLADPTAASEFSGITWQASKDTNGGDSGTAYADNSTPTPITTNGTITIRNLIKHENILGGDSNNPGLIKIKFTAHPDDSSGLTNYGLKISSVYLDVVKKDASWQITPDCDMTDPVDANNEKHNHIQLFFRTNASGTVFDPDTDDPSDFPYITPDGYIPEGASRYTNWAIYFLENPESPITEDHPRDYFLTFTVVNTNANPADDPAYLSFWAGDATGAALSDRRHSYVHYGNWAHIADWPDTAEDRTTILFSPTTELPTNINPATQCTITRNIYACAQMEYWPPEGSVTSVIYDTKITDPGYNKIAWTENKPSRTGLVLKARSSDSQHMTGATAWSSIVGTSTNPTVIASIGTGRYVQFRGELTSKPYWSCIDHPSTTVENGTGASQYYSGNVADMQCKIGGCGKYLVPAVTCPWLDDVTIDWPGETKLCDIHSIFTKKPSYGKLKASVDDQDLAKGISFSLKLSKVFMNETYEVTVPTELEMRNTNK